MASPSEIYERQIRLFGADGQRRLSTTRVCVVGVGGLGTHVVQQLALLGVGTLSLVDHELVSDSNRNRYVGLRYSDRAEQYAKVDLGERLLRDINPSAEVIKLLAPLVSAEAFQAVQNADCVFGCLDSDGARLVLNELCSAYGRPYIDLASDVMLGEPVEYGGRVLVNWSGQSCLMCRGLLDTREAEADLASPSAAADRESIYGVSRAVLGHAGPSVVSINGVVASLAVTEFMVAVTGLRDPIQLLTYYGSSGKVTVDVSEPADDCYYCKGMRALGKDTDVERYLRDAAALKPVS